MFTLLIRADIRGIIFIGVNMRFGSVEAENVFKDEKRKGDCVLMISAKKKIERTFLQMQVF